MNFLDFYYQLYVISDNVQTLQKAIDDGVKIIQLRDKSQNLDLIFKKSKEILSFKKYKDFLFILNDYPEMALELKADGVHIGQDTDIYKTREILGPNYIIGKSTHNILQGLKAQEEGVNYISVGPVFETPTKPGRPAVGFSYVKEASEKIKMPFVAIGGIDVSNILEVLGCGAKTIAIVRAVNDSKKLLSIIKGFKIKTGNNCS